MAFGQSQCPFGKLQCHAEQATLNLVENKMKKRKLGTGGLHVSVLGRIVPIPGGTKVAHIVDNLAAANIDLTAQDLNEIDAAFATIEIKGAPLSEALDALNDR